MSDLTSIAIARGRTRLAARVRLIGMDVARQPTNRRRPQMMPKAINISDTIKVKSIDTGGQSAGNGGDGTFKGAIISKPTVNYDPTNKAEGADVHVNTGDHVKQTADWDAGGANAKASYFSKAHGGDAESNGSQKSYSGYDTSKVYANTDATQINKVMVDQHQEVVAGIGGDGGDGNFAWGGGVTFHLDTL
ncbi:hypothetical protein ACVWXQ_004133 [Bradyrhizobium sp. S3.14.4]